MDTTADIQYGDSTPAPLKPNFIGFLGDAVDFAVDVLHRDEQAEQALSKAAEFSDSTEAAIHRAEALVADMGKLLDGAADEESVAGRCAAKTRHGIREVLRAESEAARAVAAAERARVVQLAAASRSACQRAVEALLLRQEPPDAVVRVKLDVEDGARYKATLYGETPYGLAWTVGLQIPDSHPLGRVLRIERVVEQLEIDAPEEAGWLHKAVKIRPQRMDRMHLAEFVETQTETVVKLRASVDGSGPGFDLVFRGAGSKVELTRILDSGGSLDSPYDLEGGDAAKLHKLVVSLRGIASEVFEHRVPPIAVTLDARPMHEHERPAILVERLVANIAPKVEEIGRRSVVPGELVLRRRLGDNRREEVFASRAELAKKLAPLSPAARRILDPLGLRVDGPPPTAPTGSAGVDAEARGTGGTDKWPLPLPLSASQTTDVRGNGHPAQQPSSQTSGVLSEL
jgi:hypothetical protein